ncbi:DUF488 family protein, N3 subclade, partial [Acetomicrobium sp. S15 = DSM 107314]|uniref:DUF488 family protein, N3 subclade n=1 Tax=Acetomicrobium sp. S15 = DSM 107314 TaxID=2529858 RepID=UPI0018E16431
ARDYALELDGKPDVLKAILEAAINGDVTLLFAAKDREHNNAVVLKRMLSPWQMNFSPPSRSSRRYDCPSDMPSSPMGI